MQCSLKTTLRRKIAPANQTGSERGDAAQNRELLKGGWTLSEVFRKAGLALSSTDEKDWS